MKRTFFYKASMAEDLFPLYQLLIDDRTVISQRPLIWNKATFITFFEPINKKSVSVLQKSAIKRSQKLRLETQVGMKITKIHFFISAMNATHLKLPDSKNESVDRDKIVFRPPTT